MTPAELADFIERSPRDPNGVSMLTPNERLLLAAALRLAEAAEYHDANCRANDGVVLWQNTLNAFHDALAAYRSARERLTGIAP